MVGLLGFVFEGSMFTFSFRRCSLNPLKSPKNITNYRRYLEPRVVFLVGFVGLCWTFSTGSV